MYTILESEKIGKTWRNRILYSGTDKRAAEFCLYQNTRQYHILKMKKDGDNVTHTLKVTS